jgi:foldase protein PrsA
MRRLLPRRLRIGMALCAAIATAVLIGACGDGVPGDAVAQIGSYSITKAALQHWLIVANASSQASTGAAAPPLPVPPDFTACIAGYRKQVATASTPAASLKTQCAKDYQTLLQDILPGLIETVWIQGEAKDRHVSVTNAEVEKTFATERATANPPLKTAAELNSLLAKSGQTIEDLKWHTYVVLLFNKIELKVQKQASKVTPAQIAAYYKKNRAQYVAPETRDVHLVETTTQAVALKVKGLLASGQSYATVAPKYSIDVATKSNGGKLTGATTGELNSVASAAIFAAKQGVLTGPVKTPFGYYVFTVDKITPSTLQSLKAVTASIRSTITQTQVGAAINALRVGFSKKWLARTHCRSGYAVSSDPQTCPGAPPASTGASGTVG